MEKCRTSCAKTSKKEVRSIFFSRGRSENHAVPLNQIHFNISGAADNATTVAAFCRRREGAEQIALEKARWRGRPRFLYTFCLRCTKNSD
jgi:hypothetical protein